MNDTEAIDVAFQAGILTGFVLAIAFVWALKLANLLGDMLESAFHRWLERTKLIGKED